MELRPYQKAALASIKRHYDRGETRQLVAMPTGTGKTVLFAALPSLFNVGGPREQRRRMLVLVHRKELADQAYSKIRKMNPHLKVGIEMGADESWGEDIIIASNATIGRLNASRLKQFRRDDFAVIVCDEAHHSVASTYMNVFEHFGVDQKGSKILSLGVTATPVRGDHKSLRPVYDKVVYEMSMLDAIQQGWLCDLKGFRARTTVNLDSVRTNPTGDFVQSDLERTVDTIERNNLIVESWNEYAKGRQTVVFCVDIRHGKDLAATFRDRGISADCIWGDDPERQVKLKAHKDGKLTVLTNCGVLTEGYDDWQIGCVLLARPTKSTLLYVQMVGRGTRIAPSDVNLVTKRKSGEPPLKEDCLVIDVVDNTKQHRLVTMASFLGLEPEEDLLGESILRVKAKSKPTDFAPGVASPVLPVTATVEEIDLFAKYSASDVIARSVLNWFRTSDGTHILPLPDYHHITISPASKKRWVAQGEIEGRRFASDEMDSFDAAKRFGEKKLQELGRNLIVRLKAEEQLDPERATPTQVALLKTVRKGVSTQALSKAAAADLIRQVYAAELNALPVDDVSDGGSPLPPVEKPFIFTVPFKLPLFRDSVLQWFETDEGGYALPLPEKCEIRLTRRGARFVVSGRVSGKEISESEWTTLELAVAQAEHQMRFLGTPLMHLLMLEKDLKPVRATPIQEGLLKNFKYWEPRLLDRSEATEVIKALYQHHYAPTKYPVQESQISEAELSAPKLAPRVALHSKRTEMAAPHELDIPIRAAAEAFFSTITTGTWIGRERDAVNLFVFGHLLKQVRLGTVLFDPSQVGIEMPVPQVDGIKRTVCKDVVIWPRPCMTVGSLQGTAELNFPLCVMEWKSINEGDDGTTIRRKNDEYRADVQWLKEMSGRQKDFVGYALLLDVSGEMKSLSVTRVVSGEESKWLNLGGHGKVLAASHQS